MSATLVKDLIYKGVESKPRDKWPTFDGKELDRSAFVTASEIGQCERRIWFSKAAAKQDDAPEEVQQKWGFFARGHNVEAWVVDQLRAAAGTYKFMYVGTDQRSFYAGDQSCTPDGIMVMPDGSFELLEFKSIDPRTNLRNLPKKEHLWQCQQNMDIISHCLDKDIVKAHLVYVQASDYMQIYEYEIEADHELMDKLEKRAAKILAATKAKDMQPEGMYDNGCRYCTFTANCSAKVELQATETKRTEELKNDASKLFG